MTFTSEIVTDSYLRLVLEVDSVAVALLEDAGVEVVLVLHVQVPAADVSVGHVVAAQLGRLDVPNVLLAAGVLVADFDGGSRDAVHSLKQSKLVIFGVIFFTHLTYKLVRF